MENTPRSKRSKTKFPVVAETDAHPDEIVDEQLEIVRIPTTISSEKDQVTSRTITIATCLESATLTYEDCRVVKINRLKISAIVKVNSETTGKPAKADIDVRENTKSSRITAENRSETSANPAEFTVEEKDTPILANSFSPSAMKLENPNKDWFAGDCRC